MMKKAKATGIKTWPVDDRPREKLLKKGPRALSNSELLAILLRTGTNGSSAIDIARKVMKKFGVTEEWIRDLIQAKKIKAAKIGQWRVKPKDLEEFIKSRRNY